jgi:ligand-binding SRPBCC domain-containing protein
MKLTAETWVPAARDDVFPFFADAGNLQRLTPPWLHFSIRTRQPIAMSRGASIEYRISLHGLPMRWESEITRWEPPDLFVDEQRRGPYRRWIHTHRFIAERGGTRLVDEVSFDLVLGWLAGPLVARDLQRIFTYRHETLHTIFGNHVAPNAQIVISR